MPKILCISDIHLKWQLAQKIIDSNSFDRVVFTGDFFDDFYDTPEMAEEMSVWVKNKIHELGDNGVFIYGNHDIGYAFPFNPSLGCSGFTLEKAVAINNVLTVEDWRKFKLHHFEDDILYSHAGVHPYVFLGALEEKLTIKAVDKICEEALENAVMGIPHAATSAGRGRGGDSYVGGITWLDWKEFEPVPHIAQVVGHTPARKTRVKRYKKSTNYCLDTGLNHYAIVQDGHVTIKKC